MLGVPGGKRSILGTAGAEVNTGGDGKGQRLTDGRRTVKHGGHVPHIPTSHMPVGRYVHDKCAEVR